jgi:hypothetical protein
MINLINDKFVWKKLTDFIKGNLVQHIIMWPFTKLRNESYLELLMRQYREIIIVIFSLLVSYLVVKLIISLKRRAITKRREAREAHLNHIRLGKDQPEVRRRANSSSNTKLNGSSVSISDVSTLNNKDIRRNILKDISNESIDSPAHMSSPIKFNKLSTDQANDKVKELGLSPVNNNNKNNTKGGEENANKDPIMILNCSNIQPPNKYSKSANINTWIRMFDVYVNANRIQNKVDTLLSCMDDEVLALVSPLISRLPSEQEEAYSKLKDSIKQIFRRREVPVGEARSRFFERVQLPDDGGALYYAELLLLAKKAFPQNDTETVRKFVQEQFISGLINESLKLNIAANGLNEL